jgi:hypothetical protein
MQVFVNNPTLAHFLGLEHSNINDIWYDFMNMVLLTVYFFNYGNPINSKGIRVRFSMTSNAEKDLSEYADI